MKVKVLYRDYKNKIERYYDEIDYKKGAYDKATKSIEIEFDEKYDAVFEIATYEQILKICEIIRNDFACQMKDWFLEDVEVFKLLNDDQKKKAMEMLITETPNGKEIVKSATGLLKKLGFENSREIYRDIRKKLK